jgi:hypothetical protein
LDDLCIVMDALRSYPTPSGDGAGPPDPEEDDLQASARREIQQRRAAQSAAKRQRWKRRQWITFVAGVAGAALFLFGLNLAVDWPGDDRSVDRDREMVTLEDLRKTETDSATSPSPRMQSPSDSDASPDPER